MKYELWQVMLMMGLAALVGMSAAFFVGWLFRLWLDRKKR